MLQEILALKVSTPSGIEITLWASNLHCNVPLFATDIASRHSLSTPPSLSFCVCVCVCGHTCVCVCAVCAVCVCVCLCMCMCLHVQPHEFLNSKYSCLYCSGFIVNP